MRDNRTAALTLPQALDLEWLVRLMQQCEPSDRPTASLPPQLRWITQGFVPWRVRRLAIAIAARSENPTCVKPRKDVAFLRWDPRPRHRNLKTRMTTTSVPHKAHDLALLLLVLILVIICSLKSRSER